MSKNTKQFFLEVEKILNEDFREFFFCKMRGYQIFHLLLSFCKATI